MTPGAEVVSVQFTRSVISSKASFTYEEAQNRISDLYDVKSLSPEPYFNYSIDPSRIR